MCHYRPLCPAFDRPYNRNTIKEMTKPTIVAATMLLMVSACGSLSTEVLPLEVVVAPEKTTVKAGDSILVEVRAQGSLLLGIVVDWGDGQTTNVDTQYARTAKSTLRHVWASPGVYLITAVVTDGEAGTKTGTASITVQ
jgi:hypothetical protein